MEWVLLGILLVLAIWIVSIYNRLVALRNRFKNAFAQIDVQLKRRYDLIPNLVETAKGYLAHERNTLEAVIAARNGAASATQRAAANPADGEAMKQMVNAFSDYARAPQMNVDQFDLNAAVVLSTDAGFDIDYHVRSVALP